LQIWFVKYRYDTFEEELTWRGFVIATRDGQCSRWDERPQGDPPTGFVHVRAFLRDEHDQPDRRVSFTATERWAADDPGYGAINVRGYWLAAYAYQAVVAGRAGTREFRYDFDPDRHPEMPYHYHPESDPDDRRPWGSVDPATVIDRLQQVAADEMEKGNL
jgi:hypothetical protein